MSIDSEGDGIGELIRCVREGQETVFDLVGDVDGEGKSIKRIEISRRKLQPEPPILIPELPIARAKARDHTFNDIDAFCAYLNREASKDKAVVLADTNTRTITAVLDESDEKDREEVRLQAIEHPLFSPWSRLMGRDVPVVDFALFVMQHRRAVIEPDGREVAMIFSQVKMAKAITMYAGTGKKSLNGVIVDIEIAGERKGAPVELPEDITIDVPLFVGTSSQSITLDLLVTNKGEAVIVYATAADVEEQRIKAFEEMVGKIKATTGLLTGLGQVKERDWTLVR